MFSLVLFILPVGPQINRKEERSSDPKHLKLENTLFSKVLEHLMEKASHWPLLKRRQRLGDNAVHRGVLGPELFHVRADIAFGL